MAVDLSAMTKKQLQKLSKDVELALKSIEKKELREAKKAAEKAAAKFGFSLAELTGGAAAPKAARKSSARKPGAAKYANPADTSQTWTGKGRQPQWYKDAIAAGADPKTLEI